MKILITGGSGFIGSHLSKKLKNEGHIVLDDFVPLESYESLEHLVKRHSWDVVLHFAGVSSFDTSEKNPGKTLATNLLGTVYLANLVQKYSPLAHFIFSSSAQVYSLPPDASPEIPVVFSEKSDIRPKNVYSESKWQGELLLRDISKRHNLRVTVVRLFNQSHKTQNPTFFLPHIYNSIKNVPRGGEIRIPVGNIDVSRDIGVIQDLIRALEMIIAKKKEDISYQVYNICSGRSRNLRELALALGKALGVHIEFVVDEARVRKNEIQSVCGSYQKIESELGWKPLAVSTEDFINKFLEDFNI